VQTTVRVTARVHPHVADLAVSFPALLFAITATRRGADRARLIAAIVEGEPLAHVAALAGIPLWLRWLPPETFTQPIPPLPNGALFRRQIANHLPTSAKLAPVWLDAVSRAALWGHEGLAVWFARTDTRCKARAQAALPQHDRALGVVLCACAGGRRLRRAAVASGDAL
jgi:hypothetical protein